MKIGLSLAGGGVKGAAHIGVLKALEEERIAIDYISGTSSGSIVATLYAVGYTPDEIYKIFKEYGKKIKYFDFKVFIKAIGNIFKFNGSYFKGLNSGEIIEKLINKKCKEKGIQNIKEIVFPLLIPSVDLHNAEVYIFSSKSFRGTYIDKIKYVEDIAIGKAVRASCSYPGIFEPCPYKDTELIDGGIRENIPWKETKNIGADKVISVIFKEKRKKKECKNIIDVISNSLNILCHELSLYEIYGADYLLEIETEACSLLEFNKIEELYDTGYSQTKNIIQEIKRIIISNK